MKNQKKIIGSIVIAIIIVILTMVSFINSRNQSNNNEDIFVETEQGDNTGEEKDNYASNKNYTQNMQTTSEIKVEIKGEIKKPGVYTMEQNSRLQDLIYKAGGFKKNADKENIPSLAKKLMDEECIVIYNKKEGHNNKSVAVINNSTDKSIEVGAAQEVININTADLDGLQKIPGVGPVTAQNIIDYREKSGGFKNVQDITNVDRIGEKTFEKMKDSITVQ
ncbi:helix-hairpin-helix domain-containing protein [Clostridium oryzae]|uniref:ComE operon protein 1 n=1 Tax=Clostridium oryzae TaxID=1450648 RepID=A0A1V4IVD8_9CLOT|nr:helix-hairpin-helix domain-containing protein [Clostridium oryzae]OPJ63790.1 ComE operon protein 1 [Clostridium oryzae]